MTAAVVATVLLHVPLSVYPIARDQGLWLTAARAIGEGRVYFRDFLHFHLPGTAVAYRLGLALVHDPRHAPVLVAAATAAATVLALYLLLSATLSRAAGAVAALLFGLLWPLSLGWWGIAQKDFLAVPWVLAATWCAARVGAGRPGRRVSLFAAGAMVAVATQFKPTFLLAGVGIVIGLFLRSLLTARTGIARTSARRDVAWFVLGGAAAFVPLALYLLVHGALDDAWFSMTGMGAEYVAHRRRAAGMWTRLLGALKATFFGAGPRFGTLIAAVLGGVAAWLAWRGRPRRFWIAVPVLTAAGSFLAQGKGITYHAQPLLVTLFLFLGVAIAWSLRPDHLRPVRAVSILYALLALVILATLGQTLHRGLGKSFYAEAVWPVYVGRVDRTRFLDRRFSHHGDFPNPTVSEDLARWLRERTSPEETILVWGHECQVYALAGRRYATQAPFDQLLSSMQPSGRARRWLDDQRARFLELLERDAPRYLVITTRDRNPVERLPSDVAMKKVPGLLSYLERHYRFVRDFERFRVYERIPPGEGKAPP